MSRILNANGLHGQPPPAVVMASPFNDVQLVAMIAGQVNLPTQDLTPAEKVAYAIEIVAEAIVQMGPNQQGLAALVRQKQQELT